jgi:hypothetical protein
VSALHGERYIRFFWNVLVFMMGVLGSPKLYHLPWRNEQGKEGDRQYFVSKGLFSCHTVDMRQQLRVVIWG